LTGLRTVQPNRNTRPNGNAEFPVVPTFLNGEQTQEIIPQLGTKKGKFMPDMHQNMFGGRAPPGPAEVA